ncbi:MAG: FAD-binding oxidoreductase, partial [Oscillospiraceae bacterium]|nr:FAD-binding oxidoreductase [Oscillospiraceae bacterium]
MEFRGFMKEFILSELEDAVGQENVSILKGDKLAYATDYFWIARMVVDKGGEAALPDFVVRPGSAEEVSKVLKIANYYKIPVQTWGGGSGSQGGALPLAGGILLDIKRMD